MRTRSVSLLFIEVSITVLYAAHVVICHFSAPSQNSRVMVNVKVSCNTVGKGKLRVASCESVSGYFVT